MINDIKVKAKANHQKIYNKNETKYSEIQEEYKNALWEIMHAFKKHISTESEIIDSKLNFCVDQSYYQYLESNADDEKLEKLVCMMQQNNILAEKLQVFFSFECNESNNVEQHLEYFENMKCLFHKAMQLIEEVDMTIKCLN